MSNRDVNILLIAGLLAPAAAHAHGEEALFFPVGHLVALIAVIAIGRRLRLAFAPILLALLAAAAATYPFWVIPSTFMPDALKHTASGNFLVGLLVYLAPGCLALYLWRGYHARRAV
jgi:hypothetical protein